MVCAGNHHTEPWELEHTVDKLRGVDVTAANTGKNYNSLLLIFAALDFREHSLGLLAGDSRQEI